MVEKPFAIYCLNIHGDMTVYEALIKDTNTYDYFNKGIISSTFPKYCLVGKQFENVMIEI